jgi:hypothetical protein
MQRWLDSHVNLTKTCVSVRWPQESLAKRSTGRKKDGPRCPCRGLYSDGPRCRGRGSVRRPRRTLAMQFHIAETRRNGRPTLPWPGSVPRPRRALATQMEGRFQQAISGCDRLRRANRLLRRRGIRTVGVNCLRGSPGSEYRPRPRQRGNQAAVRKRRGNGKETKRKQSGN